jgi:peptidoglycan/xylan/chitin deacetylase (PgdA/CDA1 family)
MRASALMYHDVVAPSGPPSGFEGNGPDVYAVTPERFRDHLDRIARTTSRPPAGAEELAAGNVPQGSWVLTFDDGGSSAVEIGEELARRSWRGHFFITTDLVGRPRFLGWDEVRELARMGHAIGSHSCSHPARMADCTWERLLDEWGRSAAVLSEELGGPVSTASVPGGLYSHEVGRAAASAGFASLFTSLPTRRVGSVDGCLLIGRYAVRRDTTAEQAARAAAGRPLVWARQRAAWRLRGAAKRVAGQRYEQVRRALLSRS